MVSLRIVLCPIDFTDLSRQELTLATEVCEAFGARLVLHHNLAAVSPGLSRAWEWHEVHRADRGSAAQAEERMRKILAEVPRTVRAEASISSGPLGLVLLELAKQLPADLVVLGSHGWSTPDHASVTERIIDRCVCPVLTLQQGAQPPPRPWLRASEGKATLPVVVPTDLSDAAQPAVEYAFDLGRHLALHIHLLHVVPAASSYLVLERAQQQLTNLVPEDLVGKVQCHVEHGEAIEQILLFSQRTNPAFMVMGEHTRGFLRRFFTVDTARQVLHRASCPVWFVPPRHT